MSPSTTVLATPDPITPDNTSFGVTYGALNVKLNKNIFTKSSGSGSGTFITLTANVSGASNPNNLLYTWYNSTNNGSFPGTPITGHKSKKNDGTITLPLNSINETYAVFVTDTGSPPYPVAYNWTSAPRRIPGQLLLPPIITPSNPKIDITQPIMLNASEQVTLTKGNLTWQWYLFSNVGNAPIPGATSSSFTPSCCLGANTTFFVSVGTTLANSKPVNSTPVTVVVKPTPTLHVTPANITVKQGQNVTFNVTVTGGTAPFTVNIINETSGSVGQQVGSASVSASGGSATISLMANALGNFTYRGFATDIGTTTPYQFNSTLLSLKVTPATVLPSYIAYYANAVIYNPYPNEPKPFVLPVFMASNSSAYRQKEAFNLDNIRFFYPNGTIINSYLESYYGYNSLKTSGNPSIFGSMYQSQVNISHATTNYCIGYYTGCALFDLNLSGGLPVGNTIIYVGFANKTTNLWDGVHTGVAPWSTNTFGKYDNGKNVFPLYFNANESVSNFTVPQNVTLMNYHSNYKYGFDSSYQNFFRYNASFINVTGVNTLYNGLWIYKGKSLPNRGYILQQFMNSRECMANPVGGVPNCYIGFTDSPTFSSTQNFIGELLHAQVGDSGGAVYVLRNGAESFYLAPNSNPCGGGCSDSEQTVKVEYSDNASNWVSVAGYESYQDLNPNDNYPFAGFGAGISSGNSVNLGVSGNPLGSNLYIANLGGDTGTLNEQLIAVRVLPYPIGNIFPAAGFNALISPLKSNLPPPPPPPPPPRPKTNGCGMLPSQASNLIVSCLELNITNNQSAGTATGFQQLLMNTPFNPSLGNVTVYNGKTGAPIPAWVENSSALWINIGAAVPADSTSSNTYFIGFGKSGTNFFLSGNGIGEAAQLSGMYAKYDNGANVFQLYQDFAGNSTPSGWTGSAPLNNGLTVPFSSSMTTTSNYGLISGQILDYYGTMPAPSSGCNADGGYTTYNYWSTNIAAIAWGLNSNLNSTGPITFTWTNGGSFLDNAGSVPAATGVWSVLWTNTSAASGYFDYSNQRTATTDIYGSQIPIGWSNNQCTQSTLGPFYWIRIRTAPPNNIMPLVEYGTIYTIH